VSPFAFESQTIDEYQLLQNDSPSDTSKIPLEEKQDQQGEISMLLEMAQKNYEKAIEKTQSWRNNGKPITQFEVGKKNQSQFSLRVSF